MSVYLILKKKLEEGIRLPTFRVYPSKPRTENPHDKLICLEDGECVDVAKFTLSNDKSYLSVSQYRVSNINGQAQEDIIETYTLPRYGY